MKDLYKNLSKFPSDCNLFAIDPNLFFLYIQKNQSLSAGSGSGSRKFDGLLNYGKISALDLCENAEFVAEPPKAAVTRSELHLEVVDRGRSGRGGSSLSCEVDCLQPMKVVSAFEN